jgi:amino acid adenylation domain-containing protein
MTPQEVLDRAIDSGVFLYVENEELKYRARSGALSPELRSELARHREPIVQHLARIQVKTTGERSPFAPPPLEPRSAGGDVPLSFAQQRLWFIDRLGDGSAQYHAQSAQRLHGRLDLDALRRALITIIERHRPLRTVVAEENGTPYQVVLPSFELELPETDLRTLPEAEQELEIQRLIARNAKRPVDLGRDLMFRGHLVTLGPDRYVVLLDLHHIAADAWSLGILQKELIALYTAYCQGLPNPLPPLKLEYADYTMWQRNWLQGEPLARQLDFWKKALQDAPEVHDLPLDFERPATPAHAGGAVRCRIDRETLDAIRALCKRHDVTLFMFLQTAVSILLGRYSNETDVVMGTPVAGRDHPDLEALIGLFINTIVLRTKLDGNLRFVDLLSRNRQSIVDALTHQHVPFEMVVEELNPRRTTSYTPLFQVLFNLQPAGPRRVTLPGLTLENVSGGSRTSKFELVLNVVESEGELSINFGYSAELFLPATIERMAASFQVLLAAILAAPERPIDEIEFLPAEERQRLEERAVRAGERVTAGGIGAVEEWEAPATETEQRMARVWSTVLKRDGIGVAENFFGAGGASLSMIVLIKRIAKEFDVEIPLATFIESPTIRATAKLVDEETAPEAALVPAPPRLPSIPALDPARRAQSMPLSFAQTRLWFISRLEEGRSSYNIPAPLRLTGPVSREALRRAFETIVERHTILRTVYREEHHEPVQVILEPRPFDLPRIDLTALSPEAQARRVRELVREESIRPFDLTVEPSLRVVLIALSDEEHILLFNVHHIAADGWSIGVLTRELNALYGAYRDGREPALPDLPIQYCDYAVWQRDWLSGAVLEEHLGFWKNRLSGIPKVHNLPLDRPRPASQTYRGAHHAMRIEGDVVRGLEALSRTHNATPFMILQAALAVLLHRFSGDTDVVIGAPVANRLQSEVEPLVGCFVNTLVMRSDLADDPRFVDFLAATNENLLQAFAHQSVPFELLVEELNPERDLSHAPVFQVMFAFQNNETEAIALPSLQFKRVESDYPISKFDLTLHARQSAGGLSLTWEYATDIFNSSTIESMASAFGALLESIVRTPEEPVSALRLLTPAVEEQLLRQAQGIPASEATALCVHELFEAQAQERPDAIAVRAGAELLTYGELNRAANRLARHLRQLGVTTETLVGLCVERSLETMIGMLGILKAGGAYLPLDVAYPADRLRYMVANAGVGIVLASGATRDRVPAEAQSVILLDELGNELHGVPDGNLSRAEVPVAPESLAYVIYTSGSTGEPKGVAVEHRGVTRLVSEPDYIELGPDTVTLQACAMTFDVSTFEIWAPLLNGGTVVMLQGEIADVANIARQVEEHGVNTLWLTSGLLPLWVEQHTPALGLRHLLAGGDVVPPRMVDAIHRRDPAVTIVNGYGPTENTTFSCCHPVPRGPRETATIPIGRPIRGSSAYVLDRRMQLQPVGCPGVLYVGGSGVARGYVGKETLTRERFMANPHVPGDRLYDTGDVARWLADGTLEFLGRNDQQVKIRGFRVELGEIEHHLAKVSGVADCVVVARDVRGTGRQIVAYVVAASGAADEVADDVKERCRRELRTSVPEYMLPATYVLLERLPLSASGKIDRRALPAPSEADVRKAVFAAPATETERQIAAMWQELLRLPRVGVDDNFFELGGHSLLAARFISAVRAEFAVEIPMRMVFERPTIRDFATWLDIYNTVAVESAAATEGEEMFL